MSATSPIEHLPPVGSPFEGILSSTSLLHPLEVKYKNRCQAFYYHTPKLHGVLKALLPERYNELIGVQHIKCYLIDNDVLLSGANLSEQYFTNRQDRYMWIKKNQNLANFYVALLNTICGFSFRAHATTGEMVFPIGVPNPVDDPDEFNKYANTTLLRLFKDAQASTMSQTQELLESNDTWVFPTVQLGHANVRHDEAFIEAVLKHSPPPGLAPYTTHLTSPYFNLAEGFSSAILASRKLFEVIVAAPEANGFYRGSGVSGLIPWAYDTVLRDWMTLFSPHNDIHVYEYIRDKWTFHAKGLWIEFPADQVLAEDPANSRPSASPASVASPSIQASSSSQHSSSSSSSNASPSSRPSSTATEAQASFTLVGSSNFGVRSLERDLESQLAIFTTNRGLIERLRREREHIFEVSTQVDQNTFERRAANHSPLLKLVAPFATKFM